MSGDTSGPDDQQETETAFSRLLTRRHKRAYGVYRLSRRRKQRTTLAAKAPVADVELARLAKTRRTRLDRLVGIKKRRELAVNSDDEL